MRILHTSDWHLGRMLAGERLLEDQACVLQQILDVARDFAPQVLIVAGDVYDRAVPPTEAVSLLDQVLSELVLGSQIPVILLPGNHDSRERLSFASRLLERNRLHIAAGDRTFHVFRFADEAGAVDVAALPYLEPAEVRSLLGRDDLHDHDAALRAVLERLGAELSAPRRVLALHAFVTGGQTSESERPLAVGGTGEVGVDSFGDFHYVALGHLHQAQAVGSPAVRYAGSILKYAFSEAAQQKSVNLVKLDATGAVRVECHPLRPRRELRTIHGYFDELLRAAPPGVGAGDLLHITLLDERPVVDAAARLRERYPNLLMIHQPALLDVSRAPIQPRPERRPSPEELFADFFRDVTGSDLSPEEQAELAAAIDQWRREETEA